MNKMFNINNLAIEVYESGNPKNQTLLFAHGLGASLDQWESQFEYFKDYHVVAISLQGHGNSEKNATVRSLEDYLKTYLELFNLLSIENCIWIGNSMGGVLGYGMIKKSPHLISKLITNGTTPKLIMPKVVLKMIHIMDNVLISILGYDGYAKLAANHSTQYDMIRKSISDMFRQCDADTIIKSHQLLGRYDYLDVIEKTHVDIVVIKSPNDKNINRYLEKCKYIFNYDHVNIVEFNNTGHFCNMERPDEYNRLLLKIIQGGTVD